MRNLKKVIFMALMVCLVLSQSMFVQAATKTSSKYSITMNKTVYTIKKGKTVKLKATLNKAAKKKKVEWSTSNKKVATVSTNGKVTAKKKGKAKITAKIKGTKVKATCNIVVGTPVSKVTLNKKSLSLNKGESFTLKTTLSPKKPTNKKVTYKSSNASVATVSSKGVVKAVNAGTAKITVTAADGSGKSATCKVTVKEIGVTKVSLNETNLNLEPGATAKLTAKVEPANATDPSITYRSSNANVVSVGSDGTVRAINEGAATITAVASNAKSASCNVKVAYKNVVSNQNELNNALKSKMVTEIYYKSDKADTIVIPAGNYSAKTIEITAPNADVTNNGSFSKVIINAIAQNTYVENSSNVVYFNAPKGHMIIGKNGIATINLSSTGNQDLHLENNGYVNELSVPAKTKLNIEGRNAVPVTLGKKAADSEITAATELNITSSAAWKMAILPGAENTKAMVDDASCIPSIVGLGCIPVKISQENEIVNITAEMQDDLNIDQMLDISGNVLEMNLLNSDSNIDEDEPEVSDLSEIKQSASDQTQVYLISYNTANLDMEENYETYISRLEPSAVTDAQGSYTITDVKIGNYWMILKKEGYRTVIKNMVITSSNSDVYSNGTTTILSDEIAGCENAESISGTVIDGLTGQPVNVAGIQVKLRTGNGNIIGDVIAKTQTDSEGKYAFSDIPAGIYTVEVLDLRQNLAMDAVRYNSASIDIVVAAGYLTTDNYNCVVNQQMHNITGQGQVQFTLTWGTEESGASDDIDSHLVGPKADGNGEFHVYFSDDSYYDYDSYDEYDQMADLDVDDTDYEGPEHTTIYKETPGIYRFYIRNYSEKDTENSDMLMKSSIQVRITIGTSSYVYNCPNQIGNLWYVCDYNSVTHTIIPRNEVSTVIVPSEGYIGLSDEELNRLYFDTEKENALEAVLDFENYLSRFNSSEVKTGYSERAKQWRTQIDNAEGVKELGQITSEASKNLSDLKDQFSYPVLSASNKISDDWDVERSDDGETQYIVSDFQVFSDQILDFEAEASEEGQTVSFEPAQEESGYAYLVHVTLENGLSYDVKVRAVTGYEQQVIVNAVQECNKVMSQFAESTAILQDKARLAEIKENMNVSTMDELEEITEEIDAICDKYRYSFHIDSVSSNGSIEYWRETTYDEYDEDDNWIAAKAVLRIERDEDVTDQDILDKLALEFEDEVTYTITPLTEESDYQALIKATDSQTGLTKNIYIQITEW